MDKENKKAREDLNIEKQKRIDLKHLMLGQLKAEKSQKKKDALLKYKNDLETMKQQQLT